MLSPIPIVSVRAFYLRNTDNSSFQAIFLSAMQSYERRDLRTVISGLCIARGIKVPHGISPAEPSRI